MAGKQLGLRIDRVLYAEFLEVCRREKLGPNEAAELLKVYIASRKIGSPRHHGQQKIPPEILEDTSPLIRDARSPIPKGIGPKQVRKTVHDLYLRAGLIEEKSQSNTRGSPRNMYLVRFHTLRKFFKTKMQDRGVQEDYVEYMMGHTPSAPTMISRASESTVSDSSTQAQTSPSDPGEKSTSWRGSESLRKPSMSAPKRYSASKRSW